MLLFAATTLSFAAFLLAALVLHRLRDYNHHLSLLHLHILPEANMMHTHIPASVTVSLQAVAILGVVVSMLLWVLIAIATPIPGMVSSMLKERVSPETRERFKHAA